MNSSITEEPRIYWSRNLHEWITESRISIRCSGIDIIVPEGFATDLASVPPILRPILNSYGDYNRASIVHDYLYRNQGVLIGGLKLTRKECDDVFFRIMLKDGVPWWEASLMWCAVRYYPWNILFRKW